LVIRATAAAGTDWSPPPCRRPIDCAVNGRGDGLILRNSFGGRLIDMLAFTRLRLQTVASPDHSRRRTEVRANDSCESIAECRVYSIEAV
jgi:hypothetical protein